MGRRTGLRLHRGHGGAPPARGAPPLRVPRLRPDRDGLPPETTLTPDTDGSAALPAGRAFPHLRLRSPTPSLLALPWERPLGDWSAEDLQFRAIPVGPSRHLVRFLVVDGSLLALKEEPLTVARREFDVLRHLEELEFPAVEPVGLAESPERDVAILVTRYLAHSLQYRRLLARFPPGPHPYRERLLDAMASLLVDLHRAGIYWGDCSLSNTLFRRDGDKIQAYLVDAETSEIHPSLSDGQREADLEILVENVAFGLADLAVLQGRPDLMDEAVAAAEAVQDRYRQLWEEIHAVAEIQPGDRYAVASRIRRLNELGFAVEEVALEPVEGGNRVRLRVAVATRRFHARELERLTGLRVLEGQARILLNDLREYRAWIEHAEGRPLTEAEGAERWLRDVLEPTLARLVPAIGPNRDPIQAYCDVLETKWLLSEAAGHDVGLGPSIEAYLAMGAPAPESGEGPVLNLDIDWSAAFDGGAEPDEATAAGGAPAET